MAEPQYRHFTSTRDRGVLVLSLTETHLQDEQVVDSLLRELLDAVAHFNVRKVVIDFQRLKYMSSVAFRPLLRLRSKLKEDGGRMVLCGLNPAVGDIFYTTKMLSPDGSSAAPFQMEPDIVRAVERLNREIWDEPSPL
jgi:anti-anti-sigma factor